MNLITRLFAFALCVALAFSAASTAPTFGTPTSKSGLTPSVTTASNGVIVTLSAAGWTYGDQISVTTTAAKYWSTITASTGTWSAVGLIVVGGVTGTAGAATTSTCAAAPTGMTDLINGAASAPNCASDFATYYTTLPTAGTSSSGVTAAIPANTAVQWTLVAPATSGASTIGINILTSGAATATYDLPVGTSTTGDIAKAAYSRNYFAFYVETKGTTTVCFQTDAQHTKSASCNSGVHFSVAISGLVAMIALIFFN